MGVNGILVPEPPSVVIGWIGALGLIGGAGASCASAHSPERMLGVKIDTVAILGGGTAGFMAALTLKIKHPRLAITIIRSKEIGIIGVGEGTTPGVPRHLHGYLNLDPGEFYRQANPTWKLGIRFLWGRAGGLTTRSASRSTSSGRSSRNPTGIIAESSLSTSTSVRP